MNCPGSWALSRAPGGVSCKPASAPGWLLGGIKATHFPQRGKRMVIVTHLFDVRSIFDTVFWHLCGGAEPALPSGAWDGLWWCGRGNKSCMRGWCHFTPLLQNDAVSLRPCAQPRVRDPSGSDTCDNPCCPLSPQLAERLKLSDPLLLEMPEQDQEVEPEWLEQLRARCREWEVRRSRDAVGRLFCIVVCLHLSPLP